VQRALEHLDLRTEVWALRRAMDKKSGFENMLGHSHTLLQRRGAKGAKACMKDPDMDILVNI
jgi:hypothetical protein